MTAAYKKKKNGKKIRDTVNTIYAEGAKEAVSRLCLNKTRIRGHINFQVDISQSCL